MHLSVRYRTDVIQSPTMENQAYVTKPKAREKGVFACPICNKPINLNGDRYADENSKVMHERCYLQRPMPARNAPPDPRHAE